MATQNDINKDLYNKYNAALKEQSATNGYLKSIVEQIDKLIKLLRCALYILAAFAFACLFALIYGAIGEKGLHSVRQTMPSVPLQTVAIPAHNDFDKWQNRHKA